MQTGLAKTVVAEAVTQNELSLVIQTAFNADVPQAIHITGDVMSTSCPGRALDGLTVHLSSVEDAFNALSAETMYKFAESNIQKVSHPNTCTHTHTHTHPHTHTHNIHTYHTYMHTHTNTRKVKLHFTPFYSHAMWVTQISRLLS